MIKSSHVFGILFLVFLSTSTHDAFGHGVGYETLDPQMLGDRKVAMEVSSNVDNSTKQRQITFSLFDTNTGVTIRDVMYHVKTIKNNNVVFEGNYQTSNGILVFDLIPTESDNITVKEKSPGLFDSIVGTQNSVEARGKIFALGGLYKFSLDIISAENYSKPNPVRFDAGISFPEPATYQINDKYFGKQEIKVVTYYELLDNMGYDAKTKAIVFSMPFEWSLSNINQTSVIHEEVLIPKTFGSLQVSEYSILVNGIILSNQTIIVDDFPKENRIIHVLLYRDDLLRLYQAQSDKIHFSLFPKSDDFMLAATTENVQYRITLTTNPKQISAGVDSEIFFKIYDVFLQGKAVSVPYDFSVISNSNQVFKTSGISDDSRNVWNQIPVLIPKDALGKITIKFENLGQNGLARAEFPIAVIAKPPIPSWIKNIAKWRCDDSISDDEFLNVIKYLVNQDIMKISETPDSQPVRETPKSIKPSSCSWIDGSISDDEFMNEIANLVKNSAIKS